MTNTTDPVRALHDEVAKVISAAKRMGYMVSTGVTLDLLRRVQAALAQQPSMHANTTDLIEADRELDEAEAALAEAVQPDDPQTPDEWMADSRYRDARDRVREARARRDAIAQQPEAPAQGAGAAGEYPKDSAIGKLMVVADAMANDLQTSQRDTRRRLILEAVALLQAPQPATPEVVNGIPVRELIALGKRYAATIDKRGMPRAAQVFEGLVMIAAAQPSRERE